MITKTIGSALAVWLSAGCLLADFSYEQESKVTGGALAAMMRVAGAFSKKAREPIRSTIAVKGNRMLHQTGDTAQIIDLDKETITDINTGKKTYSVITFAQMKEALDKAMQKAKSKDAQDVQMTFSASVKETGQTREVSGLNAKQVILTMEMQGKDQKSGNEGNMVITADMWLAPKSAGYDEVANFYQRMAQKLAWTPGAGMLTMGRSDIGKGFADLHKEAAKIDGMPVLQVIRMGAKVDGQAAGDPGAAPAQPAEPTPSASEAAGDAAAKSAGRRLGGLAGGLGGLGGFGRRKKPQQEEQQPAPAQAQAQAQPAGQGTAAAGSLLEMTTETSNFSAAAVDASKLEVPSGFRQVESEMLKSIR